MAIVIRETATLQKEFDYVSDHDSALDKSVPDFAERMKRFRDGSDREALPLKDGETPTVFTLKPIASQRTISLLGDLMAREGIYTYYTQAMALGLLRAENLGFNIERKRIEGFEQVTNECIDQFPRDVIHELGQVIVDHSNPNPS